MFVHIHADSIEFETEADSITISIDPTQMTEAAAEARLVQQTHQWLNGHAQNAISRIGAVYGPKPPKSQMAAPGDPAWSMKWLAKLGAPAPQRVRK